LLAFWLSPIRSEAVTIQYIANEGFLISSGKQKVLIDALFREGFGRYLTPARGVRTKLTKASPPFDDVNLILVTHWHADHCDSKMIVGHLRSNQNAIVIAPDQVADRMSEQKGFEDIEHRVWRRTPEHGEALREDIGEISVEVFRLRHIPYLEEGVDRHKDVENLGFLLTVGGVRFFHGGDAVLAQVERAIGIDRLKDANIDVLFLKPFDCSDDSAPLVVDEIQPREIIAMHLPPRQLEQISEFCHSVFPDIVVFQHSMESVEVAPEEMPPQGR
jgi:L-ascorbate metabolism protein UlaG (beta-lactamase superfamily)